MSLLGTGLGPAVSYFLIQDTAMTVLRNGAQVRVCCEGRVCCDLARVRYGTRHSGQTLGVHVVILCHGSSRVRIDRSSSTWCAYDGVLVLCVSV